MAGGGIIIETATSSIDPGGLPPGVQGTALTPPHLAKESLGENPTTWTAIFLDFTSEPPAATRPEIIQEVGGTEGDTISESQFLDPSESGEVHGEDIVVDTMEAAEFVTHTPIGGIVEEVNAGDVEIVLEGNEEEQALPEDDKILGITPEVVVAPEPEVIEDVTPHGEEPPSETVAEEVFTEAAVLVLVKPTVVYPTEPGMVEDVSLESTIGQEVGETADDSFDISTHVEVTDVIEKEHTAIAEKPPDPTDSAEIAVPVDADKDTQMPPVELPSETPSGDKIEVRTEASPTVFSITSDDSAEVELEPVIEVEPLSQEESIVTLRDDMGEDPAKPEVEEVPVPQVEMTTESTVNEPTTVVSKSANEELKDKDTAVVEGDLVDTEEERLTEETKETDSTAEHATEPSLQFTTGAVTDDEAVRTVQGTTEGTVAMDESLATTVGTLEIPAESLPESTKMTELIKEPKHEPDQVEATEQSEEDTIQPIKEADSVKEVDVEEAPISASLPEAGEVSKEDASDVEMTPLENTEVLTGELLENQEELATVEIIIEDTGDSDFEKGGTHPEVLDEVITETFDLTTPEPDHVIPPVITVVPEDTEGLLPETEVDEIPDHDVNMQLPEDSKSDLQPGATASPSQVLDLIKDSDSEDISKVEEEQFQELPDVVPQEAVTHPWTLTKIGAIEPDKVTQDGPPKDHVISIEESVVQKVEIINDTHDVEAKDAVTPVVATSESFVKSTSGTDRVITEEHTTVAPAKPTTKYVVEYNNGNFPDITESPYFVDDNLLGNNGFGLEEDENSVSIYSLTSPGSTFHLRPKQICVCVCVFSSRLGMK